MLVILTEVHFCYTRWFFLLSDLYSLGYVRSVIFLLVSRRCTTFVWIEILKLPGARRALNRGLGIAIDSNIPSG